jgi:hypothetical protein
MIVNHRQEQHLERAHAASQADAHPLEDPSDHSPAPP